MRVKDHIQLHSSLTESYSLYQLLPPFKRLLTCGSTIVINFSVINTGGGFEVQPTLPKTGCDLIREGSPKSLAVRQTKGIINTCRIYRRGSWDSSHLKSNLPP